MANNGTAREIERRTAARVVEELSPVDLEAAFDEMLDECYSFRAVGGIFAGMLPSRVLKECDPIAYRCGVSDMGADSDQYEEIAGEVYDRDDVDAIREEVTAELEAEEEGGSDA